MKQKSLPTVVVSSFLIFYKPQHYFHQKQFYTQKSEKHKDSEINSLFNLGKKENFYGEGRKTGFERRVFFPTQTLKTTRCYDIHTDLP